MAQHQQKAIILHTSGVQVSPKPQNPSRGSGLLAIPRPVHGEVRQEVDAAWTSSGFRILLEFKQGFRGLGVHGFRGYSLGDWVYGVRV